MMMFFQKHSHQIVAGVAASIFLIHLLAIIYFPYIHHDVAQYFTAGQMVVHGSRPYVDIVDVGPPMIIYINYIPAKFSQLTNAPLAISGILFLFLLVIATMFLFVKMLKYIKSDLTQQHVYFIYICWLFSSLWAYHHGIFGQREQIIFLFLAPFLLLRHARYTQVKIPSWFIIIITSLAFCGVAIKPFYLIILILLEIVHILKYGRLFKALISLEVAVSLCLALIYVLHFYVIPGGSFYYSYWLGVFLRGYSAYEKGWKAVFNDLLYDRFFFPFLICSLQLCLTFLQDKRSSILFLSSCFGILACATLILYLWQAKGWRYQLLPFYYGIFIGGGLFFLGIVERMPANIARALYPMIASFFFLISHPYVPYLIHAPFAEIPFLFAPNKFVETITSLTDPDERVLFLNTNILGPFPALTLAERMHGGRFLCTYPLAFFFKNSSNYVPEEQWKEDEKKFYTWLQEDIRVLRPKLIFINTADNLQATAPYFKISEYLRRKGFYTEIAQEYHLIGHIESFQVYLLNDAR